MVEKKEQIQGNGEPGRTRTSNPLLYPEMLCSWLFKHFFASYITVLHGVRQGFVLKPVPRFSSATRSFSQVMSQGSIDRKQQPYVTHDGQGNGWLLSFRVGIGLRQALKVNRVSTLKWRELSPHPGDSETYTLFAPSGFPNVPCAALEDEYGTSFP
ncbi:MAG TPA: hypothetical protein VFF95_21400 [Candidatus Binatus sp.]|nr:hypothetical protein [Candidatus Binatus sp.]